MADKNFSTIAPPGLTVAMTIKRASDNYYWTGSVWQVGAATVATTETVLVAGATSEYSSTTDPTARCFWWMFDSNNNFVDSGEFFGSGIIPGAGAGEATFVDAYGQVQLNIGKGVGDDLAKKVINEALRFVANVAPWPWKNATATKQLDIISGTNQYTLNDPLVKEIYGGYLEGQHNLTIHDLFHFDEFQLYDRITGIPIRILRTARDVLIPDPAPSANYTAQLFYYKRFSLVNDADEFPCGLDFVDAITDKASQLAAGDKGRDKLYRRYGASYNEKIKALRKARIIRKMIKPGDDDFMEIPVIR